MRILVVHSGGLGDLVLAEPLFSGLRRRYPAAVIELACRADVAAIPALFAKPPDRIRAFPFDPYQWAVPDQLIVAQIRALAAFVDGPLDLLISAELRGTWLGEAMSAILKPRRALLPPPAGGQTNFDTALLLRLLDVTTSPRIERIATRAEEHELERYARIIDAEHRLPKLRVPVASRGERWLAVMPSASLSLKRWSPARFAEAATRAARIVDGPIVLLGSDDEIGFLSEISTAFPASPQIVTSDSHGLPQFVERLAGASGFIGSDSGLAHLASALGVPGVTVYGGGIWPPYAPWAPGSAGVVAPIPCFGCNWNCAFNRSFCLEGVDVESVVNAFSRVYHGEQGPITVEVEAFTGRERAIFEAAAHVHQATEADRSARLVGITRVHDVLKRVVRRARLRERHLGAKVTKLENSVQRAVSLLGRANPDAPRPFRKEDGP